MLLFYPTKSMFCSKITKLKLLSVGVLFDREIVCMYRKSINYGCMKKKVIA